VEAVEEGGLNWDYIADRAIKSAKKTLSPLHRGSVSEKARTQSQASISGGESRVCGTDGHDLNVESALLGDICLSKAIYSAPQVFSSSSLSEGNKDQFKLPTF
jgi:hypothetical protein